MPAAWTPTAPWGSRYTSPAPPERPELWLGLLHITCAAGAGGAPVDSRGVKVSAAHPYVVRTRAINTAAHLLAALLIMLVHRPAAALASGMPPWRACRTLALMDTSVSLCICLPSACMLNGHACVDPHM